MSAGGDGMAEQQVAVEHRPAEEAVVLDEFRALLKREFRPRDEEAEGRIEAAVRTLAEQALANTRLIGDDALKSI